MTKKQYIKTIVLVAMSVILLGALVWGVIWFVKLQKGIVAGLNYQIQKSQTLENFVTSAFPEQVAEFNKQLEASQK